MKRLLLVLILLPLTAGAADLPCVVPTANVARAIELCEQLRINLRIRSAEWSNDICATQFLRIGLLAGERATSRRAANTTVQTLVNDAVTTFSSTWAVPEQAECGDGTLDTEDPFSEECDDGNRDNGDGCDDSCVTE